MNNTKCKIYLVGGAVRDQLLGIESQEKDWVVVGSTLETLLAQGYKQVGKDFPVFLHPDTNDEYALARTERKSGKGYKGFVFDFSPAVTLEADLLRRDLTINAIAQADDGTIIDPYGGCEDLKNRILRHVSPAFIEDPLRVLRVARFYARFSQLGFKIADETLELMYHMVNSGELNALTPERVWMEVVKALQTDQPQQFFYLLRECEALKILFPEIENLFGVPSPFQWHPEIDSGIHTMMTLQQAALMTTDLKVRFAALVHDLGKAITPKDEWPRHHEHGPQGVPLIKQFCKRYRVPNNYTELALLVARYHIECHRSAELKPSTLLTFLMNTDALRRPDRFAEFLMVCEADHRGRFGREHLPYPQRNYLGGALKAIQDKDAQELLTESQRSAGGIKIKEYLFNARTTLLHKYQNVTKSQ